MTITHRQPVVLIGIGNTMRRDDGVGPLTLAAFRSDPLVGCDIVELDGEATRVIETWRDRDVAIVVDAVCTGERPGTIHDLTFDELHGVDQLGLTPSATSSHFAGIAEALALGRSLDRLPAALRVLGIEPGELSHGFGLSPSVTAGMDELLHKVRHAIMNATRSVAE